MFEKTSHSTNHSSVLRSVRRTAQCALAALLLASLPASAINSYIVNLKNGSTIISKYRPVETDFDPSLMYLMTSAGNTIAIAKDDIESIVSDLENRGFGTVIDTTTIVVGFSANDSEEVSDEAFLQELSTYSALNSIMSISSGFSGAAGDAFGFDAAPAAPEGSIPLSLTASPALSFSAPAGEAPPQ